MTDTRKRGRRPALWAAIVGVCLSVLTAAAVATVPPFGAHATEPGSTSSTYADTSGPSATPHPDGDTGDAVSTFPTYTDTHDVFATPLPYADPSDLSVTPSTVEDPDDVSSAPLADGDTADVSATLPPYADTGDLTATSPEATDTGDLSAASPEAADTSDDPSTPLSDGGTTGLAPTSPPHGGTRGVSATSLTYTAEIDLSSTTKDGPGYRVSGSTPPYTNTNFPVYDPNRGLTFTADATGKAYLLKQTGVRTSPPSDTAPKEGTSIFLSVTILAGVNITLVASSIDLPTDIRVEPGASLNLLLDGSSYVRRHINVPETASITIDSLNGNDTTDVLFVVSTSKSINSHASIGGSGASGIAKGETAGAITINGGGVTIVAHSTGAGIGGGGGSPGAGAKPATNSGDGGTITINGGKIFVTQYGSGSDIGTGPGGAGIGGGGTSSKSGTGGTGGTVWIRGGEVKVRQYSNAAGIGAGVHGSAGTITIDGGDVDAEVVRILDLEAGDGAAIGGSAGTGSPGTAVVTINGGTVRAVSPDAGPGIGNVNNGQPITITITGGEVFAQSKVSPGIGYFGDPMGSVLTITGGTVIAQSDAGAAIGSRLVEDAPAFCLGPDANVTAVSGGAVPAFTVKDNSCAGYYVNAKLNAALSTTAAQTLKVLSAGKLFTSITLPAKYVNFGYSSRSDQSRADNILAYNDATAKGTIVRTSDKSAEIYSVTTVAGYKAHNGVNGALPVQLATVILGIPAVTNVGYTTATFHSTGQFLPAGSNFQYGGFLYSTSPDVDAVGKLDSPDATEIPWTGFTTNEITAPVAGLAKGTKYYMQTYLATSQGLFYSAVVPFTTASVREINVIDLSVTTAGGTGYQVTGVTTGSDEYLTRFPLSDGQIGAPTGVLTFDAEAEGATYRISQSGVLAAPADPTQPKHGTSIFAQIAVADGVSVTLIVNSIDLIGRITLGDGATVTLSLSNETTSPAAGSGIGSFVHGSVLVPGSAALTIDNAPSGGRAGGALTVLAAEADPGAAAIGGAAGQSSGVVTIADGTVTAVARDGAGIGGGQSGGGTVVITGGTVTAISKGGAGIGGGHGSAGAAITIDAAAWVTAYSAYTDPATGSRPAIDPDAGGNGGSAFYVNAALDAPLSDSAPVDLLVFPDAYADGDPDDRTATLTLPFDTVGYRAFAYTTGASARTDNLYADLGPNATLGRTEYRVVDRVLDDAKQVFSVATLTGYDAVDPAEAAGSGVLLLKLRQPAVAGVPSASDVAKDRADLTSSGHALFGQTFVSGGFVYAPAADQDGRPDGATAVDLPWGLTAFDADDVTRNTLTDADPADPAAALVPNTRYYAIATLTVQADLYLDVPPGPQTVESATVAQFVTAPSVVSGAVGPTRNSANAVVSAVFTGGDEALTVTIHWSTDAIDPHDPASWAAHDSMTLGEGEAGPTGVPGYALDGLTAGETYHILVVAANETGYDFTQLTYTVALVFTFTKVDERGQALAGVGFALSACVDTGEAADGGGASGAETPDATSCDMGDALAASSDESGLVEFTGLEPGRYLLAETATLPGYQLPTGGWYVTIDPAAATPIAIVAQSADPMSLPPAFRTGDGDLEGQLLLPNYRLTDVPPLGGVGLVPWVVAGIVLVGGALSYGVSGGQKPTAPARRQCSDLGEGGIVTHQPLNNI